LKILLKFVILSLVIGCLGTVVTAVRDKHTLREGLIRLHVVADSNEEEDQNIKLQVRDTVLSAVRELSSFQTVEDASAFLNENLFVLEEAANEVLANAGMTERAKVTLCREEFPIRYYESFKLPSGVYESLRVTIGSGEGQNWWCVVFPKLCVGAATEDFRDAAVSAGFSDRLTRTISNDASYEISFFFLDCLGRLENFFHFR